MKRKDVLHSSLALALLLSIAILLPEQAHAVTSSGLPIDGPLTKLTSFVTGPLAIFMVLIGICGGAVGWFRSGEFGAAIAGLGGMALIGGVLMTAPTLLPALFGQGALLH
jgi:type IV secretory pathway VirB2 component (pilin)